MPILIKRKETLDEATRERIVEQRAEIVNNLLEFMSYCYTTRTGSKYSLMGPAGKLLSLLNTTKLPDWEKVKGYIANVVRMNQNWIDPTALESLDQAVNAVQAIREKLNEIEWLDFISGVDYELFFQLFKTGVDRAAEKIRQAFQEFLEEKFIDVEKANEVLKTSFQEWNDADLNAISAEISEAKEIIDEFWKYYKKKKKKQQEEEDNRE